MDDLFRDERLERETIFFCECDSFDELLVAIAEAVSGPMDAPGPLSAYFEVCRNISTELSESHTNRSGKKPSARSKQKIQDWPTPRLDGSPERTRILSAIRKCEVSTLSPALRCDAMAIPLSHTGVSQSEIWSELQSQCDARFGVLDIPSNVAQEVMLRVVGFNRQL